MGVMRSRNQNQQEVRKRVGTQLGRAGWGGSLACKGLHLEHCSWRLIDYQSNVGSLAETPESAGMLRFVAQICLQIFTSFSQIYDVQRS